MATNFTVPGTVPYPTGDTPMTSFGEAGDCPPGDGRRSAPFFFNWGAANGVTAANPCFEISFTNNSNMPKQIASVYVDNGRSHQGIYLLFPDTQFRLQVAPFTRGFYPVLTNAQRFLAGIFNPAAAANDHTIVHAINWLVQPLEGSALIQPISSFGTFDPASSVVGQALSSNASGAWQVLRNLQVQLGGITATTDYLASIDIKADGVVVHNATLFLPATEFVDANWIVNLTDMDIAAISWSFDWTVISGTATSHGTASGNTNFYGEATEPS